MFLTTVVIILSIVIQKTTGYPVGAPSDACDSFIPTGHGVGAQGGTSNPYEIVVSNTNYSANEVIQGIHQLDIINWFYIYIYISIEYPNTY